MKVSDYIVRLLEAQGIKDIYGIPGVGCGHFLNSVRSSGITNHLTYHEQGAAFAACGYAQALRRPSFAYTTAGPGGTNLLTGIANAYADSIPAVFMFGEKDLAELKGTLNVRQKASQEVDITEVCRPVTKWSVRIESAEDAGYIFGKAFHIAGEGRPGPVLIDFPSDIARQEIEPSSVKQFVPHTESLDDEYIGIIIDALTRAERPLILAGNGAAYDECRSLIAYISDRLNIPVVSTLPAQDSFAGIAGYIGFIGMDGDSSANSTVNQCDLLITFGARLNFKQAGYKREKFAEHAQIIRVDADTGELGYRLGTEKSICADTRLLIPELAKSLENFRKQYKVWYTSCVESRADSSRKPSPNKAGDEFMAALAARFPEGAQIAVDTGSHRRWLIHGLKLKNGQRVYQSAGLASMGYALPASIGICCALKRPVISINGDGGIMMNLQEMQTIAREKLPVDVFVFNNRELGDIMEFQKRIFNRSYIGVTEDSGYMAADYEAIAGAFGFKYARIESVDDIAGINFDCEAPRLTEIIIPKNE